MAQGVYHESTQTLGVDEDQRPITNQDTTQRRGLARGEQTTTSHSTIPHWMGQFFRGYIPKLWLKLQQQYYDANKFTTESKLSSDLWAKALIAFLGKIIMYYGMIDATNYTILTRKEEEEPEKR